ncbi:hypothetical protein FVF58_34690 [Paraburkholderia panacisoli]|jgi:hypothetical protein|uniref:Uncharacterized protein n=1 Tax=Paraburkholderia panacisoli TaxID=2603818 RepID=A0A5B0GK50_9BURK|nr:hypothetical protein [Paraburkholderia panacisoli]KAA1003833.1 hypothetical protein FVF58_34690 [Paraburkholderia panacisoli]
MKHGSWGGPAGCEPARAPVCAFFIPVWYVPSVAPGCDPVLRVPRHLEVQQSTTPQSAFVGGREEVLLSVEYLVETGAASPSVSLTTASDGSSSTWTDSTPAVGYHVQEDLLRVKAGTKLTLAVNNVDARVRWCESICC